MNDDFNQVPEKIDTSTGSELSNLTGCIPNHQVYDQSLNQFKVPEDEKIDDAPETEDK